MKPLGNPVPEVMFVEVEVDAVVLAVGEDKKWITGLLVMVMLMIIILS